MTRIVTGLFEAYEPAHAAVEELEGLGVPHAAISLVANDAEGRHAAARRRDDPSADLTDDTAQDAGAGAGLGAAVGGAGGLLAGLGLLAIPGIGPVIAAGWLVSTLAGAVVGAAVGGAAGGLVGALTHAGVPAHHAHVYAEGVRRGGALVTARVEDDLADEAEAVLHRLGAVDPDQRDAAYRRTGWEGFDEAAPVYTAQQAASERAAWNATPGEEVVREGVLRESDEEARARLASGPTGVEENQFPGSPPGAPIGMRPV